MVFTWMQQGRIFNKYFKGKISWLGKYSEGKIIFICSATVHVSCIYIFVSCTHNSVLSIAHIRFSFISNSVSYMYISIPKTERNKM